MKKILKAILLWFTAIFIVLFILAIDEISFKQILVRLSLSGLLILMCAANLNEDDLEELSLYKWFTKHIEVDD